MSLKFVEIDFARNTVYECGAVFLVVLACPDNLTEERSAELHASLCAKAVWLDHLAKPDDYSPIEVKPQYAFRNPVLVDRDVRFVAKRFQRRRIASDMIIPFCSGPRSAVSLAYRQISSGCRSTKWPNS